MWLSICAPCGVMRSCGAALQDEGGRMISFLEIFKEMGELQTFCWINAMGAPPLTFTFDVSPFRTKT